jgi:hypothetical protein
MMNKMLRKLGVFYKVRAITRVGHATGKELVVEIGNYEVAVSVKSDPTVPERITNVYGFHIAHLWNGFSRSYELKTHSWKMNT